MVCNLLANYSDFLWGFNTDLTSTAPDTFDRNPDVVPDHDRFTFKSAQH
jgi:hypothetical protein